MTAATFADLDLVELHIDPTVGDRQVARLPAYCRPTSHGNGRRREGGGYWHRPRSAAIFETGGRYPWPRLSVHFWCGGTRYIYLQPGRMVECVVAEMTAHRPAENLCGTCDGRAEAYYDRASGTVFAPRDWFDAPTWCPNQSTDRDGACPLCGARMKWRNYPGWGWARHRPGGPMTIDPCEMHGWRDALVGPTGVRCSFYRCGWSAPFHEVGR